MEILRCLAIRSRTEGALLISPDLDQGRPAHSNLLPLPSSGDGGGGDIDSQSSQQFLIAAHSNLLPLPSSGDGGGGDIDSQSSSEGKSQEPMASIGLTSIDIPCPRLCRWWNTCRSCKLIPNQVRVSRTRRLPHGLRETRHRVPPTVRERIHRVLVSHIYASNLCVSLSL
jgi:hypothetical protein